MSLSRKRELQTQAKVLSGGRIAAARKQRRVRDDRLRLLIWIEALEFTVDGYNVQAALRISRCKAASVLMSVA